jgi:CBS domain-containing protein
MKLCAGSFLTIFKIRDVMSKDMHTASPEMPISKVLDILRINRISGLPVVEQGKLVGILSIEDIVRAMQKTISPPPPAST